MSAQKMTLVTKAPKKDPRRSPEVDEANVKQRKAKPMDINARDNAEDRVFGVHTRARWGGNTNLAELMADSQNVQRVVNGEAQVANPHTEEDGDSDGDADAETLAAAKKLKVEDLRAALDAAEVEYDPNAKKAELVQLYVDNELGEEADED